MIKNAAWAALSAFIILAIQSCTGFVATNNLQPPGKGLVQGIDMVNAAAMGTVVQPGTGGVTGTIVQNGAPTPTPTPTMSYYPGNGGTTTGGMCPASPLGVCVLTVKCAGGHDNDNGRDNDNDNDDGGNGSYGSYGGTQSYSGTQSYGGTQSYNGGTQSYAGTQNSGGSYCDQDTQSADYDSSHCDHSGPGMTAVRMVKYYDGTSSHAIDACMTQAACQAINAKIQSGATVLNRSDDDSHAMALASATWVPSTDCRCYMHDNDDQGHDSDDQGQDVDNEVGSEMGD